MNRSAAWTGAVLLLIGLAVVALKVGVYGIPLLPADDRGMWNVEMRITVRGDGGRGSVSALLPTTGEGQTVFDERSSSDRLTFSIRTRDQERVGVWRGSLGPFHEIVYEFRVQSSAVEVPLPGGPGVPPPVDVQRAHGGPTLTFPSGAPEVAQLLGRLGLPPEADPAARVRSIFSFVTHEVATVPSAGDDALLTLSRREGSEEGKTRLLVTLLRGAGVPARAVRGLQLREGVTPEERVWSEAWLDGRFVPLSPADGLLGERPAGLLALGEAGRDLVQATGARAVGFRYTALRERLRPEEVAAVMAPDNRVLAALSLYRLPVATQTLLRSLLLIPLGALVVALFRNVVGVPTYGTFMPVLIGLALRGISLGAGLLLVASVLLLGVAARLALDRLRLLMVPRLSILLCLVVLTVTALALLGRDLGQRSLVAGVLFPIVILTMLVERFFIKIAEEGMREALVQAGWSILVIMAIHPVFHSVLAEHLMFSFPELVVCTMGVLVWIGGWTGYRVSDLLRFRGLAGEIEAARAD